MASKFNSILNEKCPKCEKGAIFSEKGNVFTFRSPKMHEKCPSCGITFEKEPGYFIGALYVSYGLAVLELIIAYFILALFNAPLGIIFIVLFLILSLFSFFNFRFARVIWMYIFCKY